MPVTIHHMAGEQSVIGADLERAQAASALAWWLEMGVDVAVQETPRNWLKPAAERPTPPAGDPAEPNIARPSYETLSALQGWLASSTELPLASATARRMLPMGPED